MGGGPLAPIQISKASLLRLVSGPAVDVPISTSSSWLCALVERDDLVEAVALVLACSAAAVAAATLPVAAQLAAEHYFQRATRADDLFCILYPTSASAGGDQAARSGIVGSSPGLGTSLQRKAPGWPWRVGVLVGGAAVAR